MEESDENSEHAHSDHRKYSSFLDSRPESFEVSAIDLVTKLQSDFPKVPMHIVHLSAASALPKLRQIRGQGLPLSVETCFHYCELLPIDELTSTHYSCGSDPCLLFPVCLNAEDVPDGRTDYKCCPPVRSDENREKLWSALIAGDIDFVVSDHSPCVASLKLLDTGNFKKAWGGIGGLGLGLSLMHTQAKSRGLGLPKLMEWLAAKPAKQIGLQGKKGALQVGADADFVLFDQKKEFIVRMIISHPR